MVNSCSPIFEQFGCDQQHCTMSRSVFFTFRENITIKPKKINTIEQEKEKRKERRKNYTQQQQQQTLRT